MLNAGDGTTEIFTTEKSGEGMRVSVSRGGWSSSCFSGLHRFCRSPDGCQGDDVVGDVYPLHRLQWEMSQESSAVVGKTRWRSGEGRKPECGLRRTKAQALRAERRAVAADNLDVAHHGRLAPEEVRHGLLVKTEI